MKSIVTRETIRIFTIGLFASLSGTVMGAATVYDADGTLSPTQDGWTVGNGSENSNALIDGATGVWHISDPTSDKTQMYKNPGIIAAQGIVIARVKAIDNNGGPSNSGGNVGYSSASGNHSCAVCVRPNNTVNLKVPGGAGSFNPIGIDTTSDYRVYALAYTNSGGTTTINAWYSTGNSWSSTPGNWTQFATNETSTLTPQSAFIDSGSVARDGLLMGEFGSTSGGWEGNVDYIAYCSGAGEQSPWLCNPTPPPPTCGSSVTPAVTQTTSAFLGGAASPGSFNYTLSNTGAATINYNISEAKADGSAFDYPWLSAAPTSGSIVSGGANVPVTATITAPGQTEGLHTGYLKFTDGCSFAAGDCLLDHFDYFGTSDCFYGGVYPPSSPGHEPCLVGQGGWSSTTTSTEFTVDTDASNGKTPPQLRLNGGGDSLVTHVAYHDVNCGVEGTISVKVKIMLGAAANQESHFWALRAYDTGGRTMGLWQGTQFNAEATNPTDTSQLASVALTATYKIMEMRINTASKTTDYYFDGALLASYPHDPTAANIVARVEFQRIAHLNQDQFGTSANDSVFLDDVQVSTVAQYKLRRIDLNVIGCSLSVSPQSIDAGACGGSTTQRFTITNNGAFNISGYTVTPVDGSGNPHTYPWLSLTYGGGAIATSGSDTVTAHIDWSQVSVDETASLKFSANCSCGGCQTPRVITLAQALSVHAGAPVVFEYNGGVFPNEDNSAGPGMKFAILQGVDQGVLVTGQADTSDGRAYHLNDSSGAKTSWRTVLNDGTTTVPAINPAVGATLVARFKVVSVVESLLFGNIMIFHNQGIAADLFWGGPGSGFVDEILRNQVAFASHDGEDQYHIFRLTTQNLGGTSGIVIKCYFDEAPTPIMTLVNASPANNNVPGFGFGAESTSTAQDLYFDWVTGTNAGAFAPGDEVACIGRSLIPTNPCSHPWGAWADTDHDGDVDMDDFAILQRCYTGPNNGPLPATPAYCACMDRGDDSFDGQPDFDGDIDQFDMRAFTDCFTGPGIPWSQASKPNCNNSP